MFESIDVYSRKPFATELVPVSAVMTRDVSCAPRDLRIEALASLMVKRRIGCVPVVDHLGRPIGIVTKLDLVEQLIAVDPGTERNTAYELMMPVARTLGHDATVAEAAALMDRECIHHLPIVGDDGRIVGIISSMDIVRWLAENDA